MERGVEGYEYGATGATCHGGRQMGLRASGAESGVARKRNGAAGGIVSCMVVLLLCRPQLGWSSVFVELGSSFFRCFDATLSLFASIWANAFVFVPRAKSSPWAQ